MLSLKSEMKQGSLRHASVGRSTGLISLMDLPSLRSLRIFGRHDGYFIQMDEYVHMTITSKL
jgi:hypothetical protein